MCTQRLYKTPLFFGCLCAFLCAWLPCASALPLSDDANDRYYFSDDDDSGSESSDLEGAITITPEDYAAMEAALGGAAHRLKQRTVALRLAGTIDLARGSQLAGAAELAGSVRLLMQQGMLYQAHPEDQPEVLDHVLTQLRYLNRHTGAIFHEQADWNNVAARLNALGAPSYDVAQEIIDSYLPAVEHANDLAQAEATFMQAVQRLFDAFLLAEPEGGSESEEESEEEDSEDTDDSDEEDGSSEYSDSEDSSSAFFSSHEDFDDDSCDDLSGYTTDVDSDYDFFDSMDNAYFMDDGDFFSIKSDEVDLLSRVPSLPQREGIALVFPSSKSFCCGY